MNHHYVMALETRLEWLDWAQRQGADAWARINDSAAVLPQFTRCLERGETFVMDEPFCRLVDHARRTVPDSTTWDPAWLIRPAGWMWMAEPVHLPDLRARQELAAQGSASRRMLERGMMFRAVGWQSVPAGATVITGSRSAHPRPEPYQLERPGTQFLCYQRFADYDFGHGVPGFGSWSYFLLTEGDVLGDRLREFESFTTRADELGAYEARTAEPLHEMRWVYTAMYMMAQRLAVSVKHEPDRATRRRAEHRGWRAPPFIEVVTLRRLELNRVRGVSVPRDWDYQWEVRGHWRNQWHPSTQTHKATFIEAYVKGPADKPFKEPGTKLFVARR